jgi:plasmid stabilization system protein ParE
MEIGEAVKALKEGKKITYLTWRQDQYVTKIPTELDLLVQHKYDGTVVPWTPSQDELLSKKFLIYNE